MNKNIFLFLIGALFLLLSCKTKDKSRMPDNSSVGSENIHEDNIDRHDQRVHVHIIIKNSGIIV
jgi:major membrane immunogen (membrane-anchored lipoprotein)